MKKSTLSVFISCIFFFTTFFSIGVKSQEINNLERSEAITLFWNASLENVRLKYGVSKEDFVTFQLFESDSLLSLEKVFFTDAGRTDFDLSPGSNSMKETEKKLSLLYEKFLNIKKEYPSSVEEYTLTHSISTSNPCDSSGCTNMDFDQGTLNTWYGYYAVNGSGPPITGWTGGALGAVTEAANDPNSEAWMNSTGNCNPSLGLTTDYQISLTSSGNDFIVPAIQRVSPWATGKHSVMIGDSQLVGQGAALLTKTFYVSSNLSNLTYQYAILLMNPNHTAQEQPFFSVTILDENGNIIPNCGTYEVTSGYGIKGFDSLFYNGLCGETHSKVYYRNWTLVNVPLKNYIGQCVTIEFEVADCSPGGHFGYAYIDASCSPLQLLTSSPNFCGQDSISITAPPGAASYAWTGPYKGIKGGTNTETIWVDSAGVYRVVTIPVTGATCADTLYVTVGKLPGPPPKPGFKVDTLCAGVPVQFINTSNPSSGSFSWDFYNLGIYDLTDTNNFNPTWTYVSPGVYTVKLHELANNCGYDTLIKVAIDTPVSTSAFAVAPLCIDDTVHFTPTAQGASTFNWNFGDPSSGSNDSSKAINAAHFYTTAGTYTVTLKANNAGNCGAAKSTAITIYNFPKPVITGEDSICKSATEVLSVTGGTSYSWSPGSSTGSSITITPSSNTVYTVTASNGNCTHDTTFKITTLNPPSISITPAIDTICPGDIVMLTANGTGAYKWSTGSTATSIPVSPTAKTIYHLRDSVKGTDCPDTASATIIIRPAIVSSISHDTSVCPKQPVTIAVTESGEPAAYQWSNGASNSSITIYPNSTTTYTAVVSGIYCYHDTLTNTVTVVQLPTPVITGATMECYGVKDTLTVSSSTNPTTYLWSNGNTHTTYYTGNINADSTITVAAYNALGCSDTANFTITIKPPPAITVIQPPALECPGSPVLLEASATGIAPFAYYWQTGGETTDTITVYPDSATTYSLTVSNGCNASKIITVNPDEPIVNACCNQTLIINHDTTTIVANGTGIKSYQWENSSEVVCLNPPLCNMVRVAPTVTTTYTVIGTDTLGCPVESTITITIIECFNFEVPNVFTPDYAGPNGNDNIFYIKTDNISAWSLIIYDRWGKEIYKSNDPYQYWNGTTEDGVKAPDGVYFYTINAACENTTYKKDGSVQLIRKQ